MPRPCVAMTRSSRAGAPGGPRAPRHGKFSRPRSRPARPPGVDGDPEPELRAHEEERRLLDVLLDAVHVAAVRPLGRATTRAQVFPVVPGPVDPRRSRTRDRVPVERGVDGDGRVVATRLDPATTLTHDAGGGRVSPRRRSLQTPSRRPVSAGGCRRPRPPRSPAGLGRLAGSSRSSCALAEESSTVTPPTGSCFGFSLSLSRGWWRRIRSHASPRSRERKRHAAPM